MLYARIHVAKTDWTNLKDPKVMEKYRAELSTSGIEDSTGEVQTEIQFNHLLQTPDYIKNLYNGWLADFDASNGEIPVDESIFDAALIQKDNDPNKVVRDNPKDPNKALSPYKITAQQIGDRLNTLVKLRKSAYEEASKIDELSDMSTKRNKFIEKYFGAAEVKRRTAHYNTLKNAYYGTVIPEIEKRGKDLINKLIDCFTKINDLGQTLYDSETFGHASKKGNEFIRNLKAMVSDNRKTVDHAYNYLYSAILAGDGLARISKTNSRLKKIASSNDKFATLNNRIDAWMKTMGYTK